MTTIQYIHSPYLQTFEERNIISLDQTEIIIENRKTLSSKKKYWTKEEDEMLIKLISINGPHRWKNIARIFQTKTAKQCRDHYFNCLDPKIKNSLWTEEEKILLNKYEMYGTRWSKIKEFLPGRTTSTMKAYLKVLLQKNHFMIDKNSIEDDEETKSCCKQTDFDITIIDCLLNKPVKL